MNIIPKFLKGGTFDLFFSTYTPIEFPQEKASTRLSSRGDSSSSSDDTKGKLTEKDLFLMIKELDGLPNDMRSVASSLINTLKVLNILGMDTGDLATLYINNVLKLSTIKLNKARYDDAMTRAISNGSLNEIAISPNGLLLLHNRETNKLRYINYEDWANNYDLLKQTYSPLTVQNVLDLRANSNALVNDTKGFDIANSSVGYEGFLKLLDATKSSLGTMSMSESGLTDKSILVGLSILDKKSDEEKAAIILNALDGVYSYESSNSSNLNAINSLINYYVTALPRNAKIWAASLVGAKDINEGAKEMVARYLSNRLNTTTSFKVDYKGTNNKVTGTSKGSNEGKDPSNDIKLNTPMKFLKGLGLKLNFVINPGTKEAMLVLTTNMPLTDNLDKNIAANASLLEVSKGNYSGILDFNNASIGGNIINSSSFNGILVRDAKVYSIDYPCTETLDGRIIPDISPKTKKNKQEAEREIKAKGIDLSNELSRKDNIQTINEIYQKYELNPAYDSEGNPINNWKRFAVMNVVTSDRAINIDVFDDNELLRPITDNTEIDNLLDITKDDKFKKPGWFSRGNHFYEGTLWIPLNVNYHMASVGLTQDQGDNKELDKRQQALDAANNWNTGPKI